jgi:hypothetical protein
VSLRGVAGVAMDAQEVFLGEMECIDKWHEKGLLTDEQMKKEVANASSSSSLYTLSLETSASMLRLCEMEYRGLPPPGCILWRGGRLLRRLGTQRSTQRRRSAVGMTAAWLTQTMSKLAFF